MKIRYAEPYLTGNELKYMAQCLETRQLSGDGPYTKNCNTWLAERLSAPRALLTHSGTAALEMAALLLDLKPGDEVIMPSFTFVSTANAVVLRGATPVFIDIRPDTLNMDEKELEKAITSKTRAIFPVHYAGVGCEMDVIMEVAKQMRLLVVEDAAHGILAQYKGKELGSFGDLSALSFHETKNLVSGEGGALVINQPNLVGRAEILREKGTNRSQFFRGQVDKYTWQDIGSSYLPSELIAAFLWAQLEKAEWITSERIRVWNIYHEAFRRAEELGRVTRPTIPEGCSHNGHIYYLLMKTQEQRDGLISFLKDQGITATFHYIPLHSAPAGKKYGRSVGTLDHTEDCSSRLVRLPLWAHLDKTGFIIEQVEKFLAQF